MIEASQNKELGASFSKIVAFGRYHTVLPFGDRLKINY